jgi:hypothetical protein
MLDYKLSEYPNYGVENKLWRYEQKGIPRLIKFKIFFVTMNLLGK